MSVNTYDGTQLTQVAGKQDVSSFLAKTTILPTAIESLVGQQRLYIGATTSTYTKGGIYECQAITGTDPTEYEWVLISAADIDLSQYKKIWVGSKADWDLLTTAEKTEYDEAHFDDDEGAVETDVYSTTETKTNKVWIDGKPIYRKVIEQTLTSGVNTITHNLGIERYVDVFLSKGDDLVSSSDMQQMATYRGSDYNMCPYNLSKDKLYIACVGWTGYTVIILEYTKTT